MRVGEQWAADRIASEQRNGSQGTTLLWLAVLQQAIVDLRHSGGDDTIDRRLVKKNNESTREWWKSNVPDIICTAIGLPPGSADELRKRIEAGLDCPKHTLLIDKPSIKKGE